MKDNKNIENKIKELSKNVKLNADAKGAIKHSVLEYAKMKPVQRETTPQTQAPSWFTFSFMQNRAVFATLAIALVLFSSSGAVVFASQDALPGDVLYKVKIATEDVREALAFTQERKKEIIAMRAQRRLDEAQALSARLAKLAVAQNVGIHHNKPKHTERQTTQKPTEKPRPATIALAKNPSAVKISKLQAEVLRKAERQIARLQKVKITKPSRAKRIKKLRARLVAQKQALQKILDNPQKPGKDTEPTQPADVPNTKPDTKPNVKPTAKPSVIKPQHLYKPHFKPAKPGATKPLSPTPKPAPKPTKPSPSTQTSSQTQNQQRPQIQPKPTTKPQSTTSPSHHTKTKTTSNHNRIKTIQVRDNRTQTTR